MSESAEIAHLLSARAVRERARRIFELGLEGRLPVFRLNLGAMDGLVEHVHGVVVSRYPSLDVPLHARSRHFDAGGVARLASLDASLEGLDEVERAAAKVDLVVTSVLLDAGAGERWRYVEPDTGLVLARSEGLAVASLELFRAGTLSADGASPRADAAGLERLTLETLASAFQVTPANPLVGLEGRLALLHGLGRALRAHPSLFGSAAARPGGLVHHFLGGGGKSVAAEAVLDTVLRGLGSIWPGRVELHGTNLGDVWPHESLGPKGSPASLVPFHKLSQWLSYSLVEPLSEAGIEVTGLDALTGLPEYRNGGLFLDLGVIEPKDSSVLERAHAPGSTVVVEWRALTVALLDEVADALRARLGRSKEELPLAKVLEGGTWSAGREIARALRADGSPPLRLESDGTVF